MHILFNHGDKRLALACDKVWPFLFQVDRDVFIERWSVLFNDCESGLPTSNHRMYPYKRSKTWKYWYCVYWWDKQFYKHVLMKSWDHLVSLLLGIERKNKPVCVLQDRVRNGKSTAKPVCWKHPSVCRRVSAWVHGQVIEVLLFCGKYRNKSPVIK